MIFFKMNLKMKDGIHRNWARSLVVKRSQNLNPFLRRQGSLNTDLLNILLIMRSRDLIIQYSEPASSRMQEARDQYSFQTVMISMVSCEWAPLIFSRI